MISLGSSDNIHALLKDETRRKIIGMLGEHEKVGFKEFRDNLKIGVGTLYYHLDILSDFIVQDKNRKYALNEKGQLLYKAMTEGMIPTSLKLDNVYRSVKLQWLFLAPLFNKMDNAARWIPLSAIVLALGAVGSGLASLSPLLLFYSPTLQSFEMIIATFLFDWLGVFFLASLLSRLLFKRSGDELHLFVCTSFAVLPLAVYPYLYVVIPLIVSPTIVSFVLRTLLLVLQVWSLILLTSAFSFGKGLKLEKAGIISLSLLYINIALLVLLGNLT